MTTKEARKLLALVGREGTYQPCLDFAPDVKLRFRIIDAKMREREGSHSGEYTALDYFVERIGEHGLKYRAWLHAGQVKLDEEIPSDG